MSLIIADDIIATKFCRDCKHCQVYDWTCWNGKLGLDVVTGEPMTGKCADLRQYSPATVIDNGWCGPHAAWFEPKEGQ